MRSTCPCGDQRTGCGHGVDNLRMRCGNLADNLWTRCGKSADTERTTCGHGAEKRGHCADNLRRQLADKVLAACRHRRQNHADTSLKFRCDRFLCQNQTVVHNLFSAEPGLSTNFCPQSVVCPQTLVRKLLPTNCCPQTFVHKLLSQTFVHKLCPQTLTTNFVRKTA